MMDAVYVSLDGGIQKVELDWMDLRTITGFFLEPLVPNCINKPK
jgi:hypothetical protein